MKRIGTAVALAMAVLAGAASSAGLGQAQRQATSRPFAGSIGDPPLAPRVTVAPPAAVVLPQTNALFSGYVRDNKVPGIVGAFGVGDGLTVFPAAGRIGDAARAPAAGPDTLWRIYSMTKPVTGIAAMILVEEGKLRLDQPISDFFPGFARMRVLTSPDTSLDARPARTAITVRHLLTHTAGLGYSISAKGPLLKEYERLGLVPLAISPSAEAAMRQVRPGTLAAFAERVATVPLVAEPGTRWHYSIGLDVLAAVVERASGTSFERFVQTRLFDPLGMRSTYWRVPAGEMYRLADNYAWVGDTRVPLDPGQTSVFLAPPSFPYGGAGLVSSARDYDRFLQMLTGGGALAGRRVMKAETVRLATSDLLPAGVVFHGVDGASGPMGFGAGGAVYLTDGPGGMAAGTFGWAGAAGTFAFVNPATRVRGTVMVNYFPADKWPIRAEAAAALGRDVARLAPR